MVGVRTRRPMLTDWPRSLAVNLLVMRDTAEAIRIAEKLLATLDIAEPEVMLELEVLEVSRTRLLELGVQFPSQVPYSSSAATTRKTPA